MHMAPAIMGALSARMVSIGSPPCHAGLRKASGLWNDFVGIVRQTQQQKGSEGDCNLNANGILGGAQEVAGVRSAESRYADDHGIRQG
jgi:hypothetical protein